MSLGRLTAALATASNEVTIAGAAINFDFTLIKYEAPKEYHGLGQSLSRRRKQDAETGTIHITARRLRALFEGLLPQVPHLVEAYGKRVSEIAEAAREITSSQHSPGLFSDYAGVDGTTIWAAATSGPYALHLQLLSCILARVWPSAEAVAIWEEIIKTRREEIAQKYELEEEVPIAALGAATQQGLSHSRLAEWDASVRAWLRTADTVKRREQTQLLLITENIGLPINYKTERVYESVMAAWRTALESMNSLIQGVPQSIESGAVLLGLCSWHLYPDVIVLASKAIQVYFNDTLIAPGGVLTLGMNRAVEGEQKGARWSLSLAHLKYYGHPVAAEGHLKRGFGRVSFQQFTYAVFGSLLGSWDITFQKDSESAARWFRDLYKIFEQKVQGRTLSIAEPASAIKRPTHWLRLMVNAALAYLDIDDPEHEITLRLVKLGQRRSMHYFTPQKISATTEPFFGHGRSLPFFGLTTLENCEAEPFHGLGKSAKFTDDLEMINYIVDQILDHVRDHEISHGLCALAAAGEIYRLMPDANVSIEALNHPIGNAKWAACLDPNNFGHMDDYEKLYTRPHECLSMSDAFACTIYFESGGSDIGPTALKDVVAIDPHETPEPYEFRRILGNMGRPGITMVVSTANPIIREPDPSSWAIVDHSDFDGQCIDHFGSTTVHLSTSGYDVSLELGARGTKDVQVSMVEAIVSIYEAGTWMGDIDVLTALKSPCIIRLPEKHCGRHTNNKPPTMQLFSVDSWMELIDSAPGGYVVRASGNWMARLAATALIYGKAGGMDPSDALMKSDISTKQQGIFIVICPSRGCWTCIEMQAKKRISPNFISSGKCFFVY
ncbi:hypothetical protein AOQ84DRAFT_347410 [Glonium stellatum]|uniref:Uncharacterized protein n=1 Tax=Glonium stellatum TaxID=574774 RepID=A0A8E2ES25_9PEZI|nr:hypothetical protein AOQ84DRAFT_347410 [Glonium stellatum]